MKTLKLTVLALAIMLTNTLAVSATTLTKVKSVHEAKQDLYKKVKTNLVIWSVMESMESNNAAECVVYCTVNKENNVQILKIEGDEDLLNERITDVLEKHPVKSSDVLQGTSFAFKIRFERR